MSATARFPTLDAFTAYRDACDAAEGLPKPGTPAAEYPYGWTLTWATPVEDNGAFPCPVCDAVPVPDGVPVVHDEVL